MESKICFEISLFVVEGKVNWRKKKFPNGLRAIRTRDLSIANQAL